MPARIRAYLQAQIEEIERDSLLRWYGAMLALVIPASYIFMRAKSARVALGIDLSNCWPFLPGCDSHPLRGSGEPWLLVFWAATLTLSLWAAAAFASHRAKPGWWALAGAFLLKGFLQLSDYGFMGNYHYMPYICVFGFLFLRPKTSYLKLQVVFFYFFAGLLKLNAEWLSGAAVPDRLAWLTEPQFQTLAYLVLPLEMVSAFLLLARSPYLRAFALLQVGLFHLFSVQIVGFFYPTVMACLLSIFALEFCFGYRPLSFARTSTAIPALCLFILAQIVPWLSGNDPTIFTNWRLPALNMFDANIRCEAGIYVRRKGETIEYVPDYRFTQAVRTRCDPIGYRAIAAKLCHEHAQDPDFLNVDILMSARRSTDSSFTPVINEENTCGEKRP